MSRLARPEILAALVCALLSFLPVARVPAGFALLCLLPGVAVARRWLGETSPARLLILGSLLSLCVVPVVAIPASLLAGHPTPLLAVLSACVVTILGAVGPAVAGRDEAAWRIPVRPLAALAVLALAMQVGLSAAKYPSPDTIRWKGLPDLMFFNGIYTQLTLHTPPLDPENGAALLVHNWIYHFHFALVHLVTGLSVPAMERLVSAWMALALLGLVCLLGADVLKKPAAGVWACLLLMTSGEIYWAVKTALRLAPVLQPLPWVHSPFGVTILFGWYNLAPLCAGLGAWYWIEKHRESNRRAPLAASVAMCCAMAFFHPVFYGVFMIGLCLWLAWLWLREGARPGWLVYLATPLPFFLFYKLPYYGAAMPPQVVHPALSPGSIATQAIDLTYSGGIYLGLAAAGLLVAGASLGPAAFILAGSVALRLLVRAPNPHWFNDLLYIVAAIAAGAALARLTERWRRWGAAVGGACRLVAGVSLALHLQAVLSAGHTYSVGEMAAGAWLRDHTGADDLVAIVPNSTSSYTVLGLGRRRLVHGWTGHLLDFHHDARRQEAEVREIFTTVDAARAAELAARYRAAYIYIGPSERAALGPGSLPGDCFPAVFAEGDVEVRAFTCAGEPGASPAPGL
jgi:hypothetical protein